MRILRYYAKHLIWLMPVALVIAYYYLNPFAEILSSETVSLRQLNAAQKSNIALAAKNIDGYILAPGQTFSFNKVIGPRTEHQGYSLSRSYLGPDTMMTYGGGICLLSSVLYKNAIELGLLINERTAHTRTTLCIPAGYDATVWYGQHDLKFTNNKNIPLKIGAMVDAGQLTVHILGANCPESNKQSSHLRRIVTQLGTNAIEVMVVRDSGNQLALISRDAYTLSRISKQQCQINN
jgi:vancomycin resistance protein YoaR